jgi:5,10-methylenetetrahydrofolate reductase
VTAELRATDGADAASVARVAAPLVGIVDAVNCTDNSAAHVHISPLAAAHLVRDAGLEPILQLTCRDRNRLALQADLLGAAALGVPNVVCMTGDDVTVGDHPEARPLYDIDSMHLIRTAWIMREGTYLSGRPLDPAPSFFLGGVENPFAPPHDFRPLRLQKKVEAGADFFQLQIVFNLERLRAFMKQVCDMGIHERAFLIASVCVPRSVRTLTYLRDVVPGIDVPDLVVRRLEEKPPEKQSDEGVRLAVELVQAVREIPGISGVHLIAIRWDEAVARVAEEAGLLPRPAPVLAPAT